MLAATATGGMLTAMTLAQAQSGEQTVEPRRPDRGGSNPGPKNAGRMQQNPDIISPPATDRGTLPNLRFSFDDSHMRLERGGWTRQVTARELGISKNIAGVNMRLNAGGVRELHWHKAAEWSYMLTGTARITAIDADGRNFVDDVGVGDLWYFPPGVPHSIQGLDPDGCEFLLVFDDGDFDEDNTFLLSDWFKHTPAGEEFRRSSLDVRQFSRPERALYFLRSSARAACIRQDRRCHRGATQLQSPHDGADADPDEERHGADHRHQGIPGLQDYRRRAYRGRAGRAAGDALASKHRQWQYYIDGQARMGVFAASGQARTFDFHANDVGYVPFAMGHYVEKSGNTTLRFLEIFKSDYYADVSLDQGWRSRRPSS
jgi:oxalate decarboxylase